MKQLLLIRLFFCNQLSAQVQTKKCFGEPSPLTNHQGINPFLQIKSKKIICLKQSCLLLAFFLVSINTLEAQSFLKKPLGTTGKKVEKATNKAAKATEKAANKVGKATGKAAKKVGKASGKAAKNIAKATGKAGGDAVNTLKKAGVDAVNATTKAGEDAVNALGKAGEDIKNTTSDVINDFGKTTGKAIGDIDQTVGIALHDATKAAGKGAKDIVAETKRVGPHLVDLGVALKGYLESVVTGTIQSFKDNAERLRTGKILDAIFHQAFDPLTVGEEAAFKATQESGWLNTVAATAGSTYGGPAGAAAYSAWQTYRITGGNAELAIRAGIITGLTSAAMGGGDGKGGLAGIKAASKSEIVQKAVLAGAIGGLAIAAGGGEADDIRDGFLLGGGMMLVQEGYRNSTGHALDPKAAKDLPPYCMNEIDASCKPLYDAFIKDEKGNVVGYNPSKLDPNRPHVGIQADIKLNESKPLGFEVKIPSVGSDQSLLMKGVAKVPGMNAMALFHDTWAVNWRMEVVPGTNQLTIFPAVAITYMGTGAPLYNNITETVASNSGNQNTPNNTPDSATKAMKPIELDTSMNYLGIKLAGVVEEMTDSSYIAYYNKAPIGTVLSVANITNGKSIKVTVQGSLPDNSGNSEIKFSPIVVKTLSPANNQFWVKVE